MKNTMVRGGGRKGQLGKKIRSKEKKTKKGKEKRRQITLIKGEKAIKMLFWAINSKNLHLHLA